MHQDLYESLLNAAFRFVSYRPRSEKEIRDFLHKKLKAWKVAGESTVKKVMERMVEYGHVDDAKFVRWWVAQRASFRPKGKRLLIQELRQKGISQEAVEAVLVAQKGTLEAYNELGGAKQAIARKVVLWGKLPPLERKRKLFAYLARRGFSSDVARRVVDESFGKRYNTSEDQGIFEG